MKKIAVLMNGHIRCVNKTIMNFKEKNPELLDPETTDFFVHTWSGHNKSFWKLYPSPNWRYTGGENPSTAAKMFPLSYMEERLNIVSKAVEDNESSEPIALFGSNQYLVGFASQLYGRKRVYQMFEKYCLENNQSYDIILRTRPDIRYEKPLPIDYMINKLKNKETQFFVLGGQDWGGISDQLSIVDNSIIKTVCHQYEVIKSNRDILFRHFPHGFHGATNIETLQKDFLIQNGITKFEMIPIEHGLYRYVEITDEVLKRIRHFNLGVEQGTEEGLSIEEIEGIRYLTYKI
jgi:hypothetical protein